MLYIICVLYNKTIEHIRSLDQFLQIQEQHDGVQVCIYDNSDVHEIAEENQHLFMERYSQIRYICNKGNLGLSGTYNRVLPEVQDDDWLLWTDDDTAFSKEYLENIYQETKKTGMPVLSGIVRTQSGSVLSPIGRDDHKAKAEATGAIVENVYCINSGLCVKRVVYNEIGFYNEKLFLDMVDYWLFDELSKKGLNQVMIVSGEITQNFSGNSRAKLSALLKRFRIYRKDFKAYCILENRSWFYCETVLLKRFLHIISLSRGKG